MDDENNGMNDQETLGRNEILSWTLVRILKHWSHLLVMFW